MVNEIKSCKMYNFPAILGIVNSCSDWLSVQGMNHWKEYYTQETVQWKFQNTDIFGLFFDETLSGVVSLSSKMPLYYVQKELSYFQDPESKAFYISMLAVDPIKHKQGIASQLMTFAEDYAGKYDIKFIRLEAYAPYAELNQFYRKRNYNLVQTRDDEGDLMNFYEKKI